MFILGKIDSNNIVSAPNAEEVKEYYDSAADFKSKVEGFVKLLKASNHFVVYTGAGISTAAKIPDYRGPNGVWTLLAQGKKPTMKISLEQASPTYSHMAIVELIKRGICKYVVSTNLDGLHRRSGITADQISELHGNIYTEVCDSCNEMHLRLFAVNKSQLRRWTGRLCSKCKTGRLRDSIINFGENLPKRELKEAGRQSSLADLTLVIGSSMRVTPACDLPSYSYNKGGQFCICNLQKTLYDEAVNKSGGVRIFSKCDEFMKAVMDAMQIQVPEFKEETKDFERELENLIEDPAFRDSDGVMRKYNCYSMTDDGPPPKTVLKLIIRGMDLRKVDTLEKVGVELGKVKDEQQ